MGPGPTSYGIKGLFAALALVIDKYFSARSRAELFNWMALKSLEFL